MRTLNQEHYEQLQRELEKMKVKYPQADHDLYCFQNMLWAFTHPVIECPKVPA
jgi:hypothetical protein